jgi:hypothetical protein
LLRMHFVERCVFHQGPHKNWFRFQCIKHQKFSAVPEDFMLQKRVWTEDELTTLRPAAGPATIGAVLI